MTPPTWRDSCEFRGGFGRSKRELLLVVPRQGVTVQIVAQGVTVVRESTYTSCYLGLAPVLREYLEKQPAVREVHPAAPILLSGTAAGIISALATQPPDTIKTRMQVRPSPTWVMTPAGCALQCKRGNAILSG